MGATETVELPETTVEVVPVLEPSVDAEGVTVDVVPPVVAPTE